LTKKFVADHLDSVLNDRAEIYYRKACFTLVLLLRGKWKEETQSRLGQSETLILFFGKNKFKVRFIKK
jgi:hypothetical protein